MTPVLKYDVEVKIGVLRGIGYVVLGARQRGSRAVLIGFGFSQDLRCSRKEAATNLTNCQLLRVPIDHGHDFRDKSGFRAIDLDDFR